MFQPALAPRFLRANTTRMVLFGLGRGRRAPRVPKDEQREHRKRQQRTKHTCEQCAHVHVGARRARETKRADGDSEGEDRPEERGQWEREEARE